MSGQNNHISVTEIQLSLPYPEIEFKISNINTIPVKCMSKLI